MDILQREVDPIYGSFTKIKDENDQKLNVPYPMGRKKIKFSLVSWPEDNNERKLNLPYPLGRKKFAVEDDMSKLKLESRCEEDNDQQLNAPYPLGRKQIPLKSWHEEENGLQLNPHYRLGRNKFAVKDDTSKLKFESWIELEKKHHFVRLPVESEFGGQRFSLTSMVIRTAYHMVRINSENAGRVLEDDAYMSVLFQFAYAFLSLRDIFTNICEYEEVLTMILKVASDPKESLKREGSMIETVVISLTKSRNGFYTKKEELVPLFLEILEIARDPGESSKRATLLEALRKGIGEAEGSNCGLSTKKIEVSSGAQGGKEVSKSASEGYLSSSSLSLSTNCDSPVELFTKPTKIVRKNAKYTTLVEPDMYEHSEFSGCMLKSVNKLEKVSVNCVKNALDNLKQTFSEIQEQHLHLPEMQQETGNNTPSIKFKSILLILKELMTNIRKRHKGAYITLQGYVKTKTSEDDMNISDISYRFVENTPENVGNCDHLERLLWFGLSRSMQTMIGLHESMKDDFLSIQQVSKASGRELHLDEESFDSLLYLVACVRQMKKDLKQRLKGFRMKTDYCHLLYEGSNVYQKLDIFYKKQWELVKDLSLDFNFCRNYSNLNLEVAKAFRMLIEELELRDFSEEESRE